jgi:hypothetical protein
VAVTSTKKIKLICDTIKQITANFNIKLTVVGGIKGERHETWSKIYFNLFEFMNKKITEGKYMDDEAMLEQEFRETLISLKEDDYINLVGHKKAPTIRFCVDM